MRQKERPLTYMRCVFWLDKSLDSKWTALMIFTIISIIFASPILQNFDYWGGAVVDSFLYSDWDQHEFYNAVPRKTIIDYGQIPLWNPYYCGGTVMLANPQSGFLSPLYIFVLIFGSIIGLKIEIFVHLIIGMFGMYLLAKYLKMDKTSAYLSSFVYMLGSMYPVMITAGVTVFWSIAYIPFVFLYYLKSLRKTVQPYTSKYAETFKRLEYVLLSAFFLVLMVFEGGVMPFIYVVLFLVIYTVLSLIRPSFLLICNSFKKVKEHRIRGAKVNIRNIIPIELQSLTLILIFTLLIGAIKFIPMAFWISEHPRLVTDYSGFSLEILYHSLLGREQHYIVGRPLKISWAGEQIPGCDFFKGMTYGWDENGMYVGWVPLVLFLIGVVIVFKEHWKLILTGLIFLWLSVGNRTSISLWNVVHVFPIFSSLRVAQRFRIIFIFCLAVLSGLSLFKIKEILSRRSNGKYGTLVKIISFLVVLFVLTDLIVVDSPIFEQAFTYPPPQDFESTFYNMFGIKLNGSFFQVTGRNESQYRIMYPIFLLNVGSVKGYEASMEVPRNAIPKDSPEYKGEVFLWNTTGNASITYFSPNRVEVRVNASKEGYVVLNQNYSPGWKVEGSHRNKVESINGLISTFVTPDEQNLIFYYLPDSFLIGCFLTITTAFLILLGEAYLNRHKLRKFTLKILSLKS